jgi:hypothetical protein
MKPFRQAYFVFEALQVGACYADCGTTSFSKAFGGVSNLDMAINERMGVHRPFISSRSRFDFPFESRKL